MRRADSDDQDRVGLLPVADRQARAKKHPELISPNGATAGLGADQQNGRLDYFLYGPPGLLSETLEALDALDVPPERVHTKQFDVA